ncbi:hypothetical protein NL676_007193 [Syzygium grande]|nr:hypothetical protein NL676_007193 [Syzygium grande]
MVNASCPCAVLGEQPCPCINVRVAAVGSPAYVPVPRPCIVVACMVRGVHRARASVIRGVVACMVVPCIVHASFVAASCPCVVPSSFMARERSKSRFERDQAMTELNGQGRVTKGRIEA